MVEIVGIFGLGRREKGREVWCWSGAEEVWGRRESGRSSNLDVEVILDAAAAIYAVDGRVGSGAPTESTKQS